MGRIEELESALSDAIQTLRLIKEAIDLETNERIRGGRANWRRACERSFNEIDGRVDMLADTLAQKDS